MYMEGNYTISIVILSVIIAILASYSALSITAKLPDANGKSKAFWLNSGSLVMGSGVWSMHFIGMLAFHIHMTVVYDIRLTLLSIFYSLVSSFIAFYITSTAYVRLYKTAISGLIMALGIVGMHYTGMEAMKFNGTISYDPLLWFLSALIAFIASYTALFLFIRFRSQPANSWLKFSSAILMGFAISGMHYTGMKAARFEHYGNATQEHPSQTTDLFLLYGVTLVIFIILFVSWGAMYFDRNVLEKMAYEDIITRLPNRNDMNRFFDTHKNHEQLGVLFLDLDHFKAVNDTLGHDIGDMLIQEVGDRFREFINENQTVFRIGGDEFLVIVKDCTREKAEQLAINMLDKVKSVYRINGNELYVTASIGIYIGSLKSTNRSIFLKSADTAMYKAKSLGKNQYCFYNEGMQGKEVRKMELEKDLQFALEANQFYLMYQPKWNTKTNSLYGIEALIRWEHPRLGTVSPGEFIPIAEETGLITPITEWVLREATLQAKEFNRHGSAIPVSVNISVILFRSGKLFETIDALLDEVDLHPSLLELEITESMILNNVQDIVFQLEKLRSLGIKVSMDDFGTGYSSIGLLDRIPLDTIKLDRLFTHDLDTPKKHAIVNAIILMAQDLNLDVIAEGVENEEHIQALTQLGCNVMQGYFYGKPMKINDLEKWIRLNAQPLHR